MFSKGQKVVCVNTKVINELGVYKIKNNHIYTIDNHNGGSNDISLVEIPNSYYDMKRFISFEDWLIKTRKLKIKKIKEKI